MRGVVVDLLGPSRVCIVTRVVDAAGVSVFGDGCGTRGIAKDPRHVSVFDCGTDRHITDSRVASGTEAHLRVTSVQGRYSNKARE